MLEWIQYITAVKGGPPLSWSYYKNVIKIKKAKSNPKYLINDGKIKYSTYDLLACGPNSSCSYSKHLGIFILSGLDLISGSVDGFKGLVSLDPAS